ncbi:MAG: 2-dehydropantoate 2-reductase, partial [Pseudomonadota bacterium]
GIGAYYGARLLAAGHEVTLIARGAHLAAMREHGLTIKSALGDLSFDKVDATDDPKSVGPVDTVLFTVKLYDTESAAEAIKPLIGGNTTVLTLQNGIESAGILARILGPRHVLPGSAYIVSNLTAPGAIVHNGTMQKILFGETDGSRSNRAVKLNDALTGAGIEAALSEKIDVEVWKKFMTLATWAGLASVMRGELELIRRHSRSRKLMKDAIDEIVAVGQATGIALSSDHAEATFETLMTGPAPNAKPSMLLDLEQGRKLELPWLSGAVTRLGGELRVPTPVHNFMYAVLEPYINGRVLH